MKLILYSRQCTPCKYRTALKVINKFVSSNGYELEVKNTLSNYANREEAQSIGHALPFVYNPDTGLAIQLVGVTNEQLERLRGPS